jgi:tetratricopeptide (TPR) repeat protein
VGGITVATSILGAIGAGLVGGWTQGGWLPGLGGAIASPVGLLAGVVFDRHLGRRDSLRQALQVRRRILIEPRAEPSVRTDGQALPLLEATMCPTPFWGRRNQREKLREWLNSAADPPVMVLSGAGGIGKTRLAMQCGVDSLQLGWAAGWLGPDAGDRILGAVAACSERAVVLVDEADARSDVGSLLEDLVDFDQPGLVRILLIARDGEGLVRTLRTVLSDRARVLLTSARQLRLASFGGMGDRSRWFTDAARAYARARGEAIRDVAAGGSSWLRTDESMLALHARAVAATIGKSRTSNDGPDAQSWSGSLVEVADSLLDHELRWWRQRSGDHSLAIRDFRPTECERAIIALTLLGADTCAQAIIVLRRLPEFADTVGVSDRMLRNLADWIQSLYPDVGYSPRLRPHFLAGRLVLRRMVSDSELIDALCSRLNVEQKRNALEFLARAAGDFPDAIPLFIRIVSEDADDVIVTAIQILMHDDSACAAMDDQLAEAISATMSCDGDQRRLIHAIPRGLLPRTRKVLAQRQLDRSRGKDAISLADALGGLSECLRDLGRMADALVFAEEALGEWRTLAADNQNIHRLHLASALDVVGVCAHKLGRRKEALAYGREALDLWQALNADDPATHRTHLANCFTSVGACLADLGRQIEALPWFEKAVVLWRTVVAEDPRAGRSDLAVALNNLAACEVNLGYSAKAVTHAEEEVRLWRSLCADRQAIFLPNLANALNNLSRCLSDFQRSHETLSNAEEALRLWRALDAENPTLHRPRLAKSLASLGTFLTTLYRQKEAQILLEESVGLWRILDREDWKVHRQGLAMALGALGICMGNLGDHEKALSYWEEAVSLWRNLAESDAALYQPDLAFTLNNLGACFVDLKQWPKALDCIKEASDILCALESGKPALYQPQLASSLSNLAVCLQTLGIRDEALTVERSAVAIWFKLADQNPARYEMTYRCHLSELRRNLERSGLPDDSIVFHHK